MALATTLLPRPASAMSAPDLDMASLAFRAETIVLVEEPAYETKDRVRHGEGRVVESFKGTFKAGDQVPLAISTGFSRGSPFSDTAELPPGLALMFLVPGRKGTELTVFASGIKYITKDRVYGCKQIDNPGPYLPAPMKPELIALPAGAPYELEALIRDLQASLKKAERFRVALEAHDFPALAGYIRSQPKDMFPQTDELSRLAARAFGEQGDFELILELLAAKYQQVGMQEFEEITRPLRTAAGYEFLLKKSATLPNGPAAATVHELLAALRKNPRLGDVLRFTPKTLDEAAAMRARCDRLKKLAASNESAVVSLSPADLDALIYTREPALAAAVMHYAETKLGQQLQGFTKDPQTLRGVAEYFARVPYAPAWTMLARALCATKTNNSSFDAIQQIAAALQGTCPHDEKEPLEILVAGLAGSYPDASGAGAGLRAIGGDKAISQILERVQANPPSLHDQTIFLVPDIDKTGQPETIAAVTSLIASRGSMARFAMDVATKYSDPTFDGVLWDIAKDTKATKWLRADAIEAIGKRGTRRLREPIEALGRDEPNVRQACAFALGKFGDAASLPVLVSWLDESVHVAIYAAQAMGQITRQEFSNDASGVEAARNWWKQHENAR